jgi:hypothetical protein
MVSTLAAYSTGIMRVSQSTTHCSCRELFVFSIWLSIFDNLETGPGGSQGVEEKLRRKK